MGPVPFVTDLPYVWDGHCLLSDQQQASRNSGLSIEEQVEVADGAIRRSHTDAEVLEAPGKTMRMKRTTEREAGSLQLRGAKTGLDLQFADGSSFLVPVRDLRVTRYVDSLAAGLKLTAYSTVPRDNQSISLESADGYREVYEDEAVRDDLFLQMQEKLELLSIRPATSADKVSPLDFEEGIMAVAADDHSVPRPAVALSEVEGEEPRRLLSLDPQTLAWRLVP